MVKSDGQFRLLLNRVDLGKAEVGTKQPRIKADRLLEKINTFWESILLKPDGAEHRISHGACLRIGKGQMGLLIGFYQPSLLDQNDCFLESFARISSQFGRCT